MNPESRRWPVVEIALFVSAVAFCLAFLALPAASRDKEVLAEFQRLNPCPSTGLPDGACPGYQKDHIVPLCRGGPDTVANLHWLTVDQHKMKTRGDCRALPGL